MWELAICWPLKKKKKTRKEEGKKNLVIFLFWKSSALQKPVERSFLLLGGFYFENTAYTTLHSCIIPPSKRFSSEHLRCLSLVKLGCHARNVLQEKTPWEVTVDKFNDYFTDLNSKADEVVKGIQSSQISRELEWVHLCHSNGCSYQMNYGLYVNILYTLCAINLQTWLRQLYIVHVSEICEILLAVLIWKTCSRKHFKFLFIVYVCTSTLIST